MAYGTPARPEDVEAFYTDVRRGRPPSPEQLADLQRRYDAVGGISQLAARTAEQVAGVQTALDALAPGGVRVPFGAKHAEPSIEQARRRAMAAAGIERVVALVLAPHYSVGSVGEYLATGCPAAECARHGARPHRGLARSPRAHRPTRRAGAGRLRLHRCDPADPAVELLVTAHSLPIRIIEGGDSYDRRLQETAELLVAATGAVRWRVCWQSAGRTPEPWLGPGRARGPARPPGRGAGRGRRLCPPASHPTTSRSPTTSTSRPKAVAEPPQNEGGGGTTVVELRV